MSAAGEAKPSRGPEGAAPRESRETETPSACTPREFQ